MSALIGALRVTLGLDSAAFEKGASAAEKRAAKFSKNIEKQGEAMTNLGQKLSIAVTAPLVALGVKSVQAALESRDAMAQVEASIKSMGNAAGRSAEQLQAAAGGLMRQSLYDDDEILRKVTANLLTFGNVTGTVFDRAQQDAVDLAAKFGMDLQGATMMLGKALQDPVKGINALSRAGVSFSADQKKMIKDMVAAGDAAGAQKLILAELERQVKGSAAAARDANPMAALKNSFDDFMENVGAQLLQILPNITSAIEAVLDAFGSLSPGMQQAVVIGGMLAAALGPVLTVIGSVVSAMAPFLGALGVAFGEGGVVLAVEAALTGLAAAFGPILIPLAALAAAGAAIYANWDRIGPVLSDFWQQVQSALGPPLMEMVSQITSTLSELWEGPLGQGVRTVISTFIEFQMWQVKTFGPVFIALLRGALDIVSNVLGAIGDALKVVSRVLQGDWNGAWEAARSMASHALGAINAMLGGLPAWVGGIMAQLVSAVRGWVIDKLNAIWDSVGAKIDWVKGRFYDLYDAVVGHSYVPDMVDGIAAQMLRLDSVMVDKADKATSKTKAAFKKLAEEVQPLLDRLFPEAAALNRYHDDKATIDKAQASGFLTPDQAEEARRRLNREGRPTDSAIPEIMAGPLVVDMEKVQDGLDKLARGTEGRSKDIETATVRIAKSFKDMADQTISAVQQLAGAIKGGDFFDILGAVINIGTQLASIGVFGKGAADRVNGVPSGGGSGGGMKIPAFANGTSFAPGGWAMVGERGPELVNLPRGSSVYPHGTGPGGGNTYNFSGNLLTPEWWAMIRQGDIMAAQSGSQIALRKGAYRQTRRLA